MSNSTLRIEDSDLSVRAKNALIKKGFVTMGECASLTEAELFKIKNLGKKTVQEILRYIPSHGFEEERLLILQSETNKEHKEYLKSALAIPMPALSFSERAKNIIEGLGIKYLRDLVALSEERVLKQKNCGKKTLDEIKSFLKQLDLNFGMKLEPALNEAITIFIRNASSENEIVEEFKRSYPEKATILAEMKTKSINKETLESYRRCYALYKELGTLRKVGEVMGVSESRIAQIMAKGNALGLFQYNPHEYPYIAKEKLIEDYKKCLSVPQLCKMNNISIYYLKRLFVIYKITQQTLLNLRRENRKIKCRELYMRAKNELGRDPSASEMEYDRKWDYLGSKIRRSWGSYAAFRDEMNIPRPPDLRRDWHCRPKFKAWLEEKIQIAIIKRMHCLDDIKNSLKESGSLKALQISQICRIKPASLAKLLSMLIATGEIIREGAGNQTIYRIAKGE